MADSESTLVTLVCQRCSQPIKLNRSFVATNFYDVIKPVEKEKHGGQPVNELQVLRDKVLTSKGEYEKVSSEVEFVTECFKLLSETGEIDHPLCASCPEAAMSQYRDQIRLNEDTNEKYKRLLEELKSNEPTAQESLQLEQELSELKAQEAELTKQLSQLQNEVDVVADELAKEKERESKLNSQENEYWKAFNQHQKQVLELRDQSCGTELQLQYTRDQLSKLKRKSVLNTAFYISHNGHFATINGLRLGKLPSVPVEWSEINAAWGQTTLLLSTLVNVCNLSLLKYKLIPYGSQSFIQDMEGRKKQLPLYTGSRLFSDSRYDMAMVAFLDCLNQFKRHIESVSKERFLLPYQIDKDRIGDGDEFYSIRIQFNTEERWTKSLKFVLTNIRWGMAWVSANLLIDKSNSEI
jgi:beclin 1